VPTHYTAIIGVFDEVADLVNTLIQSAYPDAPISRIGLHQILVELRDEMEAYFIPECFDQSQIALDARVSDVCEFLTEWVFSRMETNTLMAVVPLDETGAVLFVLR
jgi:hypothetical protein